MKKFFSLIFLLIASYGTYAQCTSCADADVTISASNYSNMVFQANKTYCIQGNITLGWSVYFQNNVTICIPSGSSLTINNQMPTNSSYPTTNLVTWYIGGTLKVPNNIPVSFNINILNGGEMTGINTNETLPTSSGSTFSLNIDQDGTFNFGQLKLTGSTGANIVNNGTFKLTNNDLAVGTSTLTFTNNATGTVTIGGNFNMGSGSSPNVVTNHGNMTVTGEINSQNSKLQMFNYGTLTDTNNMTYGNSGPNKFENYSTFTCKGLYSTDPTLHFKNEGTMTLTANYDDAVGSVFSNCGTLNMNYNNWYNLEGTIINTGTLNVPNGNVSLAASSHIENYSVASIKQISMNSSSYIYNEGLVTFTSTPNTYVYFAGPGSTYQPTHSTSTNYGRFKWPGTQSNQGGWAKGKLNFVTSSTSGVNDTTYAGMFGQYTSVAFDSTVVFGNCTSCTVITTYSACANADGTWPETGLDCMPVNRHIRSHLN